MIGVQAGPQGVQVAPSQSAQGAEQGVQSVQSVVTTESEPTPVLVVESDAVMKHSLSVGVDETDDETADNG